MGIGGGQAGAFIELGDKLHKNFNQTTGIIGGLVQGKRNREEGARQFDLSHGLSREQWEYQKMMMEEQRERMRRIRNAMLGIGRTKT